MVKMNWKEEDKGNGEEKEQKEGNRDQNNFPSCIFMNGRFSCIQESKVEKRVVHVAM